MDNKVIKLSGPVFISPVNILYRMTTSSSNYEFPKVYDKKPMKEKNTGYVLKRKKR